MFKNIKDKKNVYNGRCDVIFNKLKLFRIFVYWNINILKYIMYYILQLITETTTEIIKKILNGNIKNTIIQKHKTEN